MAKFHKVGDRFTTKYNPDAYAGAVLEITAVTKENGYPYQVSVIKKGTGYKGLGDVGCWRDDGDGDMKIIKSNNNSIMSIVQKFKLLTKSEPEKSFVKAGVTEMDGSFTTEGKQLFDEWLLEKNKAAFNTEVVQPILEENKKDETK